ncbi:MAG: hypothetical protein L6R36_002226 [Xanthoria steineri]|nr:MAG: hypothetical protein L6R36_002226 [Xanthoria steineri]
MAALHSALQCLGPSDFSAVPTEQSQTRDYLQNLFTQAQIIIDSIPPPAAIPTPSAPTLPNSTTSVVTGAADLSASSARSEPLDPANISLQKEWSKPIKLGAKENPLGMSVYKMGGKDGRGAWFARRSVHEGLGFRKWKLGLQREFPETMEVQGGPGEGNIRGIGGERRVENIVIDGVGSIEVYHLSAQFPGPTTPRDFVTLLVTSSAALDRPTQAPGLESAAAMPERDLEASDKPTSPRHFMVISKPCIHPDCPPRDGFIRGQYESVEFIREIPNRSNKSSPTKSSSTSDLSKLRNANTTPLAEQAALTRSAQHTLERGGSGEEMLASMGADGHLPLAKDILVQEGRKRGKTISFAESRGTQAKGEEMDKPHDEADDVMEQNPVEWIMITRSDPGGSVPRFMVERGTPAGIVSDASKFLDWACKKEHPVRDDYGEEALAVERDNGQETNHTATLEQHQTNGYLAGLEGVPESTESSMTLTDKNVWDGDGVAPEPVQQSGFVSTITNAAVAGIESYAPQSVIDHLPGHQQEDAGSSGLSKTPQYRPPLDLDHDSKRASVTSTSDSLSFASAEEGFDDASSTSPKSIKSTTKTTPTATREDRELVKLQQRKKALDEQLARTREKETKDKDELTSKEEERIRKAEEKHARETTKHEQRYQKEVAKLEAKRAKDELKELEKKKKMEDRDERMKLTRERDTAKAEVDTLKKEIEMLKEQVGALQRENTALVTKVGKLEVGKKVLGEVKLEIESIGSGSGGRRSRSGSLRRKKGESSSSLGNGVEATVLG